jgi:hypothetical protein
VPWPPPRFYTSFVDGLPYIVQNDAFSDGVCNASLGGVWLGTNGVDFNAEGTLCTYTCGDTPC